MPATLPWPKIAQTPPKIGSSTPSITVFCAARKRVSACAMVSRSVFILLILTQLGESRIVSRAPEPRMMRRAAGRSS